MPEGEYNLKVRQQVQNRHLAGTKENIDYAEKLAATGFKPSFLFPEVDAAAIVKSFHRRGDYDPNPKDNSPREIVDTTFIEVVYSKKGTHIYPVHPNKKVV